MALSAGKRSSIGRCEDPTARCAVYPLKGGADRTSSLTRKGLRGVMAKGGDERTELISIEKCHE